MSNLKLALRTLFKAPFVTCVAVVSLSLGIGANTAIFSLFDQMLLRALPVADPEELVNLEAPGPKPGSQSCNNAGDCDAVFSYPMFRDLERDSAGFAGLAAHRSFGANLAYKRQTLNGEGMLVSGSYFPVLGLKPAIGRLLGPEDDENVGEHFVAVLSHAYWQNRFGESPDVLNETLVVNGQSMTIVGVAPRGFDGTTLGSRPQVFVPLTMRGKMNPNFSGFEDRRQYWVYVFARLRPGVSIERSAAAVNVTYRAVVNDVEAPLQEGMSDQTLARFREKRILVEPGVHGQSSLHDEARAPLSLLLGVTAVVLLIACANIANLLLARAARRRTELSVRLALGARRSQVVSQLLTESCLLGVLGGLGGLLAARWTLALIVSFLPPEATESLQIALDWRVLMFAAALAVGTGLLFGLFPALSSTRPDLVSTLRSSGGLTAGTSTAGRFRSSLATAQIALSMALLVAAGLFVKSLFHVSRVDLGLDVDAITTFGVSPELNGYEPARARALFESIERALAAEPGVTGVTASMVPLIAGSSWGSSVRVEGFEAGPDTDTGARFNEVGPGFFRTLDIPLLAGREFTERDGSGAPKVAIVNEAFARKFGLGRDAVDHWMRSGRSGEELDTRIVGLVQDAKYSEVKGDVPPQFFRPYRQDDEIGGMYFYARSQAPPETTLAMVPKVVRELDPNLPVEDLKTMAQQIRENIVVDRLVGTLSAAFAGLATLLAAVGLYGVLAYTVTERTREIGLRMALGADRARVRNMVLRQVGRMTIFGGVAGLAGAIALGRLAGSMLYEMEAYDPVVLTVATIFLAGVALGAGFIPAQKASLIDPMRALRYE